MDKNKKYIIPFIFSLFIILILSKNYALANEEILIFDFNVISDIHIRANRYLQINNLNNALKDINYFSADSRGLFLVGDLTEGFNEDYIVLRNILTKNKMLDKTNFIMGNHEFYKSYYKNNKWSKETFPNGETDTMAIDRFKKETALENVYYDKWIEGNHFIILGPEKYKQSLNDSIDEGTYLSENQLSWFKNMLKESRDKGSFSFVFCHTPLPNTTQGSNSGSFLLQYNEVRNILKGNPNTIVFTGHYHRKLQGNDIIYKDISGYTLVTCSTTTGPYDNNLKQYPLESEGLNVQVYKDKVIIRGRDYFHKKWIEGQEYVVNKE